MNDYGNFVSPFFASFLPTPGYLEVFSAPPIVPGFENLGAEDSELPISFSAKPIIVSEASNSLTLLALGILGLALTLKHQHKPS